MLAFFVHFFRFNTVFYSKYSFRYNYAETKRQHFQMPNASFSYLEFIFLLV